MNEARAADAALVGSVWPARSMLGTLGLVLAGTLLLALSARVQVPFWPVPMTLQTYAVLVLSMLYGSRLGAATVLVYLAEGALGLPVFAGGGGLAYFLGPTTGYLLGFVPAAFLVGWLAERGWDRSPLWAFIAMGLGTGVIFLAGAAGLAAWFGVGENLGVAAALQRSVSAGVLPFLPGALFKVLLAAATVPLVWRALRRRPSAHG